ncbi:hypothetical protein D3C87_1585540 [compost metagenome]
MLERLVEQRFDGLNGQGKKTLHVATAQPDPATIDFGQFQRIGLPQRTIERHRVTVPGQHQTTGAGTESGQQVEFAGADLLDVAGETQIAEPGRQQVDHRTIGLIEACLGTADGRCSDQCSELIFHGRQRHR